METMRDRAESLNIKDPFDYAVPQDWANAVYDKVKLFPTGIIWLYDKQARIFGRPYPITMSGWWILKLYGM